MNLVQVRAWTFGNSGNLIPFPNTSGNSLAVLASDVAPKWNKLSDLSASKGWTKIVVNSMFRTASYQAQLVVSKPGVASAVDKSYHQAGRAFDLSTTAMRSLYPNFSITEFERMANAVGFFRPIPKTEPWHFDTNDAGNRSTSTNSFPSIREAISAVGNLSTQAFSAVASAPLSTKIGGASGLLLVAGLVMLAKQSKGA